MSHKYGRFQVVTDLLLDLQSCEKLVKRLNYLEGLVCSIFIFSVSAILHNFHTTRANGIEYQNPVIQDFQLKFGCRKLT